MSVTISEALNAVRSLADGRGWNYKFFEEKSLLQAEVSLSRTKLKTVEIFISPFAVGKDSSICSAITSIGHVSLRADDSCMAQLGEYLHLANRSISQGHFELHYDNGMITFRQVVDCRDGLPTQYAITGLFGLAPGAFNKYGDGMLAVSMGLQTPEEAWQAALNR